MNNAGRSVTSRIGLVQPNLCGILRVSRSTSIALDRAPTLGAEDLCSHMDWKADAGQFGPGDNKPSTWPRNSPSAADKANRSAGAKSEIGALEMLAR